MKNLNEIGTEYKPDGDGKMDFGCWDKEGYRHFGNIIFDKSLSTDEQIIKIHMSNDCKYFDEPPKSEDVGGHWEDAKGQQHSCSRCSKRTVYSNGAWLRFDCGEW